MNSKSKPRQHTLGSPEVLLAEDNPVNQVVGMRQLKKAGCRVDLAANGHEAVEVWRQKKYLIIFMDCQMAGMDGCEATRRIREIERKEHLPRTFIIALTSSGIEGDPELCLAAGMDDYISKPLKEEDLKAVLTKVLKVASRSSAHVAGGVVA